MNCLLTAFKVLGAFKPTRQKSEPMARNVGEKHHGGDEVGGSVRGTEGRRVDEEKLLHVIFI